MNLDLKRINNLNRPDWNYIWMSMAKTISQRSHHHDFKVGSIIVTSDNTQVLSLGYNGRAAGLSNIVKSKIPGESGLLHSEINALLKLDYNNPKDKILYVTLSPCENCAMAIINSGIKKVVYEEKYRDETGIEILEEAGIDIENFKMN